MVSTAAIRAAIAALALAGCTSNRYRIEFQLPAGEEAQVQVYGADLRIEVGNAGPGSVHLIFDSPDDAQDEERDLGIGSTERSMAGPVSLRCVAQAGTDSSLEVLAWDCDGMDLDQKPAARATPE